MQFVARSLLVSGVLWLLPGWVGFCSAAPLDPAPIVDDVGKKLVRAPLGRQPRLSSDVLARHVDEALALVERMGTAGRTDHAFVRSTTNTMLLAAKLHEVGLLRGQVRDEASAVRMM